jgi:hypothetical protein
LLYTVYATTFHDAQNSDTENVSHFINTWQKLLAGLPKEIPAQSGTFTPMSGKQDCHVMSAKPYFRGI